MKKGSIFSQPVLIIMIIAIAALLIYVMWTWLGVWGAGQAKNISGGIDVSNYI